MYISLTFDPSAKLSSSFNTNLPINGKFLLTNQSNVNLLLTFADGSTAYAPAWQITLFMLPTSSANVDWSQQSTLLGQTSPISQVSIQCFLPNEQVIGTYPVSIQHSTYIGNSLNLSTSVTTLSNEGNTVGTEVIDAGTAANSRIIDIFNDHFLMSVEQSGVKHTALQGNASGNALKVGQAGDTTEVLGTLAIDQNLDVTGTTTLSNALSVLGNILLNANNTAFLQGVDTGGTARNMMVLDGGNNNKILGISGKDRILFQMSTGTNTARIDATGIVLLSGAISLLTGSISRMSVFAASVTTGSANSISHGLGATPSIVLLTFNLTSAPSAASLGYDHAALNSTTVKVWTSINANIVGLALA